MNNLREGTQLFYVLHVCVAAINDPSERGNLIIIEGDLVNNSYGN